MRTVITRKTLGLSWDDVEIRACVVRSGIAEVAIEKMIRIPRELTETGGPKHPLANDLKGLVDHIGSGIETCVAALPESEIMSRMLTRPFSDRKKIAETIGPEVEGLLPAFDSRLIVDFVLLGKDASGGHLIQVLCTPSSSVQRLVGVLKGVNLDPEIVDCPSVAVSLGARTILDLPAGKSAVLIHMGWKGTSVAIVNGRDLSYTGALPFGFERIVSSLAAEQSQTTGAILKRARESGLDAGEKLTGFFREILIMLEKSGNVEGEHVLVPTGYACLINDIGPRSEEALGIGIHIPSLKDIYLDGSRGDLMDGFLCTSLACRALDTTDAVNFRQGELGITKHMKMLKGYAGPWIKAALILFLIWTAGLVLDVSLKARLNANLTKKINAEFVSVMPKNTPVLDPVKQMEQYLVRLSGQAGTLGGDGRDSPLEILRDLSSGIPGNMDVILDSINIDEDSITLTGSTGSYDNVERIKTILAGLPYVKEVKIVSANVDKNDQKVKLKLTCKK
jgi:hypothetical protein